MKRATITRPTGLTPGWLRRVLVVLCITEVTSWGVLYYAFPVLAGTISSDTGWSLGAITAAFSASQIVAGLAGIPAGRWLDRHGPRVVMTAGSVLAVPATFGIALAPTYPVFLACWAIAGLAMAAVFYQPAFAAITRWYGLRRVRALTVLTLVAGLSSTIFAPLAAALSGPLGWRGTYLVLVGVLAVVTIPLHAFGLRGHWPSQHSDHRAATSGEIGAIVRGRPFLTLTAGLSLGMFAIYVVLVHLVPLLEQRGLSTSAAAWALGLGGVGQLLGRLGYPKLSAATTPRGRAVIITLLVAGSTAALAVLPGPAGLLIGVAVLAGMARGVFILLQATAVSDRWLEHLYPRLNGMLAAPVTIAMAIAPAAGTALALALGGYPALFAAVVACSLIAAVTLLGGSPRSSR